MTSRCVRTIAGLSLLGGIGLSACGDPVVVVAPTTTTGPSNLAGDPTGEDPLGDGSTTSSSSTEVTEVPTTTTLPPTTTTAPPTTTTTAAPPTAPPAPPPAPGADASLAFVNQKRAEAGVPALTVDPELVAMAQAWAETTAGDGNLRHNPNLGSQAPDHYMAVGENVGWAWSAAAIDEGWWNSPGHRENILRPAFQAVGIAFVTDADGDIWGVQVFAGR